MWWPLPQYPGGVKRSLVNLAEQSRQFAIVWLSSPVKKRKATGLSDWIHLYFQDKHFKEVFKLINGLGQVLPCLVSSKLRDRSNRVSRSPCIQSSKRPIVQLIKHGGSSEYASNLLSQINRAYTSNLLLLSIQSVFKVPTSEASTPRGSSVGRSASAHVQSVELFTCVQSIEHSKYPGFNKLASKASTNLQIAITVTSSVSTTIDTTPTDFPKAQTRELSMNSPSGST